MLFYCFCSFEFRDFIFYWKVIIQWFIKNLKIKIIVSQSHKPCTLVVHILCAIILHSILTSVLTICVQRSILCFSTSTSELQPIIYLEIRFPFDIPLVGCVPRKLNSIVELLDAPHLRLKKHHIR